MRDRGPQRDPFQAVADPTRREIIRLLAGRQLSIAAIAGHFPISRTAVNKHLRILAEAGLLSRERVGRESRYRLRAEPLLEIHKWVAEYERYWDDRLDSLWRYVESDQGE